MVVWTAYLKHRARLRGFDLTEIERIVRFSEERYFDVITQRTVVIGRDRKQLLLVAHEQKQETIIPITVYVTTRQQVMFMPVRTDPRESKRYWNRLEEYCSKHVLNPKSGFCCEHGEACRDSAESRSNAFAAGQLSYVGDRYAVEAEGIPMRILVVPMQVGKNEVIDMDKRRGQILGRIENPRNPHMRGVVQVLQVLFGLEPGGVVEKIHNNSHVLEAYAMANSVLCSNLPTGGKSRRGEPTRTMWKNCREHLRQTIVLLKPTIIVTQGNAPRDVLGTVVDRCEPIGDRVDRVTVGGVQATWCKLWHPAAPRYWGDAGHFREIAVPAPRHVRHLALSQQPAP